MSVELILKHFSPEEKQYREIDKRTSKVRKAKTNRKRFKSFSDDLKFSPTKRVYVQRLNSSALSIMQTINKAAIGLTMSIFNVVLILIEVQYMECMRGSILLCIDAFFITLNLNGILIKICHDFSIIS